MSQPWYVTAFGEHYNDLYHHRNETDARRAIDFVISRCVAPADERVLDLCCGAGRHCLIWAERLGANAQIVGLDLSPNLLADAREAGCDAGLNLRIMRGNMSVLPCRSGAFGMVLNLFTSFGYFEDDADNERVFAEIARVLRPGGYFFFDHIHPPRLRSTLVPESRRVTPSGVEAVERRKIDETTSRVTKQIELRSENGETKRLHESVRFYSTEELVEIGGRNGLTLSESFGDFDASPLHDDSPRAIRIFRRP